MKIDWAVRRIPRNVFWTPKTNAPAWLTCPAGLVYVPVAHDGNVYESAEEEDRIAALVRDLLGLRVRTKGGGVRQIVASDILVVAPYNLQVRRLTRRLAPIRVGTVDKFQGQEAAVVIFSMCASSGDSSPRGIEFLFNRNRLNVAISRAETLGHCGGIAGARENTLLFHRADAAGERVLRGG